MTITLDGTAGITTPTETTTGNSSVGGNLTVAGTASITGNTTVTGTFTATGGVTGGIRSGTAVASTSGTSIDFTGIPSTAKRITVMFSGVSLSSTADILVQIGDSGGISNTGYVSGSASSSNSTSGYVMRLAIAARTMYGAMQIVNVTGNNWVSWHAANSATTNDIYGGGGKTLSNTLDRVRITSTSTDTFDAGTVNILWES